MTMPATPPNLRRAHFVEQLHDLLEHPSDPTSLRWTADGISFEISEDQPSALQALSTKWSFRSLASFVRQLSYYGFTRLSDRRRTNQRRGSSGDMIVFFHPSGCFTRGDETRLEVIQRKPRNRGTPTKEKPRGYAEAALEAREQSQSDESPPPRPWATELGPPPNSLPSVFLLPPSPQRPAIGRASTWSGTSPWFRHEPYIPEKVHASQLPSPVEASFPAPWHGDVHLPDPHRTLQPPQPTPRSFQQPCLPHSPISPDPRLGWYPPRLEENGHRFERPREVASNGLTMPDLNEYQTILTPPYLLETSCRSARLEQPLDAYATVEVRQPRPIRPPTYEVSPQSRSSPSSPLVGLGLRLSGATGQVEWRSS